jgi:hypothetical protein
LWKKCRESRLLWRFVLVKVGTVFITVQSIENREGRCTDAKHVPATLKPNHDHGALFSERKVLDDTQ